MPHIPRCPELRGQAVLPIPSCIGSQGSLFPKFAYIVSSGARGTVVLPMRGTFYGNNADKISDVQDGKLLYRAVTNGDDFSLMRQVIPSSVFSVMVLERSAYSVAAGVVFADCNWSSTKWQNLQLYLNSATDMRAYVFGNSVTTNKTVEADAWRTHLVTYDDSGRSRYWLNGVSQGSTLFPGFEKLYDHLTFFHRSSNGDPLAGMVQFVYIWDRVITAPAARILARHPFAAMKSRQPPMVALTSGTTYPTATGMSAGLAQMTGGFQ